ncbi:MAG: shikimate kinase [Mariprofundales bacterium]|nr:shikimate kinase [Mariprofundales bacterium]
MRYPVLVGLMGCGKSSIGRRVAAELQCSLLDLDSQIVAQEGRTIPEIFAADGEEYFRDLESEVLRAALEKRAVIATGGGVVLREANRQLLKRYSPVIWLKAPPKFLARRIAGDSNRPLIAQGDTLQHLQQLAKTRHPLYRECADYVIARGEMKKRQVLAAIMEILAASDPTVS